MEWTIWGDAKEPVYKGTEAEVTQWFRRNGREDDDTLYVDDPEGNEWCFNNTSRALERL